MFAIEITVAIITLAFTVLAGRIVTHAIYETDHRNENASGGKPGAFKEFLYMLALVGRGVRRLF